MRYRPRIGYATGDSVVFYEGMYIATFGSRVVEPEQVLVDRMLNLNAL